jgi:hypothetical protein
MQAKVPVPNVKNGLDTSQNQAVKIAKALVTTFNLFWQHDLVNYISF